MNSKDTRSLLRRSLPIITLLSTAVIFDVLFWDRSIGLNLLLFVILIAGALLHRYPWNSLSGPARLTLTGVLVAAIMVYVQNSVVSVVGTFVALGVFIATVHEPRLRSLFFAFAQLFASYMLLPWRAVQGVDRIALGQGVPKKGWRWTKLAILPMLLLFVFFQLYRSGNPKFDDLTAGFLEGFWSFLGEFLSAIFTAHTMFFLFGLAVSAGLLFRFAPELVVQVEAQFSDLLVRTRIRRPSWMQPRALDPLERERRMGVILLVAVNLLLLVVNVIDISWVWIRFEVPEGFSLKQFVHEGTWMLVFSILLSMVILMYLFRANQNFYWRNKGLKHLAILWIGQNFILGMSVFLRNYHYISFHGLAYKRIGVMVFLALVLVGLVTLFLKVRDRKSLYYLARVNGYAAFIMLIALTTVDWDTAIVRYNLKHDNRGEIDIDNYLAMSDKVLPILYENLDLVEAQMAQHKKNTIRWVDHLDPSTFRADLDRKRDLAVQRIAEQDLLESNLADRKTIRALAAMQ